MKALFAIAMFAFAATSTAVLLEPVGNGCPFVIEKPHPNPLPPHSVPDVGGPGSWWG